VGTNGATVFAGWEAWTACVPVATVVVGVATVVVGVPTLLVGVPTVRLTTDAEVVGEPVGLPAPAAATGFTGPRAAATDPTDLLPAASLVSGALTATAPTDPTGAVCDPTVC